MRCVMQPKRCIWSWFNTKSLQASHFERQQDGAVWLCLTVTDDGPGFSQEALKLAAEPYYSESERAEHFGLGLYICTVICRQHGGVLQLANAETGGGQVRVTFLLK